MPSTTRIRGQLAIRVNLTNHRTRRSDLELLVAAVRRVGADMPAPSSLLQPVPRPVPPPVAPGAPPRPAVLAVGWVLTHHTSLV